MSNRNATVTVNTKANTSGISQATGMLKTFDSGLKGTLGQLKQFRGALAGLAVVGIAKGIKSFADEMHDAYMTQFKAEKSVNDALYSNMSARGESQQAIDKEVKAYKDLASQLQEVGVIGDEVTLSGMGIMTQMGLTAGQVKTMTPLLQDLAVKQYGLNVSSEQFTEVSRSVATMVNMGKLTLQSYGIQVTDVERKQFKAMSRTDRYAFIQNKLRNSVAGTNEAMAKTPAGKIAAMNNNIGDSYEKIGQAVDRVYNSLANWAVPIINEASKAFQEFMSVINGDPPPEGGYKYISEDDVNNTELIGAHMKNICNSLDYLFDGHIGTLNDLLGTSQFLADLQSITNEVDYLSGVLVKLKSNFNAIGEGRYDAVVNPIEGNKSDGQAANGTNYWPGGRVLVGEYGPELVDLPRGSSVNTNAQTQRELSGGGYTINCPVTVQGNVIGNESFIDQVGDAISGRVSLALSNM